MVEFDKRLVASATTIPGLMVFDLPVHGDSRGWFKENWQREKMTALGLPDFGPIQNNISFNDAAGTTRGIHAEPWDKWISVATGRVFGAWVDLREGSSFGRVFATEIDASRAIFVPRGVANAYQTLEPNTAYTYLVNDHWSPDAGGYSYLNLADDSVSIEWPIPLIEATISAKDLAHPLLAEVTPIAPRRTLIVGADGQLGRAVRAVFGNAPHFEYAARNDFDVVADSGSTARRWSDYDTIINTAAYTAVDLAESQEGRSAAWATNVSGVARLAALATKHGITLVHVSSDYVFDGSKDEPYVECDAVCPLGVYGQTKAAGDAIVSGVPRHYVLRTSWVVGDGKNFVKTMASLAQQGIDPAVVDDQIGRLTFASDIARGIHHLLATRPAYGLYNLTGAGSSTSWADVARRVFALTGHDPTRVRRVSADRYFASTQSPVAPRPRNSMLDLGKIRATGFEPTDSDVALRMYLERPSAS